MQTFTFYASDDKLENRGNTQRFTVSLFLSLSCSQISSHPGGGWCWRPPCTKYFFILNLQGQQVNEAACDLAREVAGEGDALVAGGVSQTPSYLSCKSEQDVKATFKKQLDVFVQKNVDFLIAEV